MTGESPESMSVLKERKRSVDETASKKGGAGKKKK
jgi:hypothetical protein